ncbi:MAG: RNA-directed DNA polymerase [Bacteroidetes bacterium]|nr:RNA-directed DNA polymerase [Bacteroidota bacterium]
MDQSFSVDNFKKILFYENRKGRNLEKEFFPLIFETTKTITEINKKIHKRLRLKIADDKVLAKLNEEKTSKKKLKQELIEKHLREVSEKLLDHKFKIAITKVETDDKPVYITTNTAENYFAIKKLQYNVRKSFKVKQANRFAIVNQINSLLTDNFPKIVLRTDVKSFYESIPHDKLLAKINDNPLLSFLSKKLIWKILKDYLVASGATDKVGIPRGIGVSAYLAELYMRDIDKEISSLKDVTYYARYVDDIIIVFTPTTNQKTPTYIDQVKSIMETGTGLKMNPTKTNELDLVKSNAVCELNFLGYQFQFKDLEFVQVKLTNDKMNKYKDRIINAIQEFNSHCRFDSRGARRILIHRLNFLTGNTRLENNKANVLVGIYYTNSLLSEPFDDLVALDNFLANEVDAHITNTDLQRRLKLFSFKKGFEERKYVNFSSKTKRVTLDEILKTL